MTRHVAFLRAINVGGHTVKMARLAGLFEEMGFDRVATFIASGNVLFDSAARDARTLERRIERALEESLGYEVRSFIRTIAEVHDVAGHVAPLVERGARAGERLYVAFLKEPLADATLATLRAVQGDADDFALHGRELYWTVRGGFSDSAFSGARLEKVISAPATVRSASSVQKLTARHPG